MRTGGFTVYSVVYADEEGTTHSIPCGDRAEADRLAGVLFDTYYSVRVVSRIVT